MCNPLNYNILITYRTGFKKTKTGDIRTWLNQTLYNLVHIKQKFEQAWESENKQQAQMLKVRLR
ncbi:hypothetical protein VCHA37P191_220040 [Vibrio chagasii]|jgi:hypothetical protein|nr:hypothetical protein VCHA35O143_60044 [Vibrio chagasii]CAH7093767.1 hypothetical protein VCHA31O73_90045 [Vibrio chagasii]CAH7140798.1 hypothetical protein VCHA37P191_220040 [Vibrio chagasii]CAH7420550.1 hypothetical protein VCHA53O480_90045 [Vibrio chagasii]CAH7464911.1 hypothetical protein VCHA51O444_80199 [Vibrio chagasii]